MTERRVIFWKNEGPLLAVRKQGDGSFPEYDYCLFIEDLNPELKTVWCLPRRDIFRIALGLLSFAIRGK